MLRLMGYSTLAFAAGTLLNFTPCVLPVIPLKVSMIIQETGKTFRSRLLASLAFLGGTLFFFVTLGGAVAFFGMTWGSIFQSETFLILVCFLLIAAGISLFFEWNLTLPQFFYTYPLHHYAGTFLTGALAAILSTPCTGPFLGSVLAFAITQSPLIILTLFSAIGAGLAFPYIVVLLKPSLIPKLSKFKGATLEVKQLLGFLLFAGAIFFGKSLVPSSVYIPLWWIYAGGIFLWAILQVRPAKTPVQRIFPVSVALLAVILVGWITLASTWQEKISWKEGTVAAIQSALDEGSPLLLNFTADWCLNCQVLERGIFRDEELAQTLSTRGVIPIRIDLTHFAEENQDLLAKFGGVAIPYTVLVDREGRIVKTFTGLFSKQALLSEINSLSRR